jgi:protein-tyrosine phosphatase
MSEKSSRPFGRIGPGLYMGRRPPPNHKLGLVFDAVVLCAYEVQPHAGDYGRAIVLNVPLDDMTGKPPSEHEQAIAADAGIAVASLIRRGKRVLVTCQQGRNRSGWVTGIALIELGVPAQKAIDTIRHVRGEDALSNAHFVEALQHYRRAERRPVQATRISST